mgnify:FL=1
MICEQCNKNEEFNLLRVKNSYTSHGDKCSVEFHISYMSFDSNSGLVWRPRLCKECLLQELEIVLRKIRKSESAYELVVE